MSEVIKENADNMQAYIPGSNNRKKQKKKKIADKENRKLVIATVAVILALIVFFVLTVIQDRIINGAATAPVVVAIKEVPAGIQLDEQNMSDYFEVKQRAIDQIPNTVQTYPNAQNMIGKVTGRVIHAREIATEDCFVSVSLYDGLEEPVEISLDLGAIGQTVGGVLRAGDFVDIKAVIKVEKEMEEDPEREEGNYNNLPGMSAEDDADGTVEGEFIKIVGENVGEGAENIDTEMSDEDVEGELTYGITGEYAAQLLAKHVRVTRVFNSGGENTQTTEENGNAMIATVVNIAVPKSKVDAILVAKQEGVISLVRLELPKESGTDASSKEETAETAVPLETAE